MSRNIAVMTAHTATGAGGSVALYPGLLNVTLSGTFEGTVQIERSLDAGSTWVPLSVASATPLSLTVPVTIVLEEAEQGVLWRSRCTAHTSGTATATISQ